MSGSATDRPPVPRRPAHGVAEASWREATFARPDVLPGGRPWPSVLVVVLPGDGDAAATTESLAAQAYPEACAILSDEGLGGALKADYLMVLRAGDLLAPGALAALCCEAALTEADAVAGLRVLYAEHGVVALDVIALHDGPLDPAQALHLLRDDAAAPFTGGEILLARAAVDRAGGLDLGAGEPVADLWPRLAETRATLVRIGRPVLLQRVPAGAVRAASRAPRSVAVLTDLGYRGGAGIAHRRLAEALALGGDTVTHLQLDRESPPAAAEWTETFPRAEAAAARHDLVLAGNLHGATRSTALLGRLSRSVPVAAMLHDLFALTGRCAHPKGCPLIETGCDARCPTPDEFPQLAPRRIADAHAQKQAVLAAPQGPLLLAASEWAFERGRAWAPEAARLDRIRLAFPTGVFRPRDRAAMRRQLGLPLADRLVVFGAVIADAPDKGFADLVAALRRVQRPGIGFVALGRLDDPGALGLSNLHAPGLIGDEERLAAYYAACDVHVTASRLETFGQTPIEAGLCGLPTLAYRATGLTSSVIDGVTGVLVAQEPGAPGAVLGTALAALLEDAPRRRRLGAMARIVFENRFSPAASALSLDDALVRHGLRPETQPPGYRRFLPALLGHFAFAAEPHPGATGTVARPSRPLARRLRRVKHALIGRGMPLWLRRLAYLAALTRRGLAPARFHRTDPTS